jgi:hypothetical protein
MAIETLPLSRSKCRHCRRDITYPTNKNCNNGGEEWKWYVDEVLISTVEHLEIFCGPESNEKKKWLRFSWDIYHLEWVFGQTLTFGVGTCIIWSG